MLIRFTTLEAGFKHFRIYNSWLKNSDFSALAKQEAVCGNSLFRLQQKLKAVKGLFKVWSWTPGSRATHPSRWRRLRLS